MVTLGKSRISKSWILNSKDAGRSRSLRPHFISTSLSRGNFSWSFVMRMALLSASHNSVSSTTSHSSREYCSPNYVSRSSDDSANSGDSEGSKSSVFSRSFLNRSSARRKSCKKPALLEKVPFGKSSKYLTVYVGRSTEHSVKYVISRRLLTHPLFQVLLKCSEDEFGDDYAVNNGVAIICDPALFVELVRAVDNSLCLLKPTRLHSASN